MVAVENMTIGWQALLENVRNRFDDFRPYPGLAQYGYLLGQCIAQFTVILFNRPQNAICLRVRHFDNFFDRLASAHVVAQVARLLTHMFCQCAFQKVGQIVLMAN